MGQKQSADNSSTDSSSESDNDGASAGSILEHLTKVVAIYREQPAEHLRSPEESFMATDHMINLPEEVVVNILAFADPKTLLKCRRVCQLWKYLIDTEVWKYKIRNDRCKSLSFIHPKRKLPWYAYYWIAKKDPFGKNLLRNHCGQDNLKGWKILSNGGDRWRVENPPAGADQLPADEDFGTHTSCFATSYHSCSKEQIINLSKHGIPAKLMDELQPSITVSEWYAGRFDCGCVYDMKPELLDEAKTTVAEYECRKVVNQWEGSKWQKVQHEFKGYGPGVRFVRFFHGGMDTQFWAGHYGSKMSGAVVRLSLPECHTSDILSPAAGTVDEEN